MIEKKQICVALPSNQSQYESFKVQIGEDLKTVGELRGKIAERFYLPTSQVYILDYQQDNDKQLDSLIGQTPAIIFVAISEPKSSLPKPMVIRQLKLPLSSSEEEIVEEQKEIVEEIRGVEVGEEVNFQKMYELELKELTTQTKKLGINIERDILLQYLIQSGGIINQAINIVLDGYAD